MKKLVLTDDKYDISLECLKAFREFMIMIDKLPIKKSNKLKGKKIQSVIDELINFYENEVILND